MSFTEQVSIQLQGNRSSRVVGYLTSPDNKSIVKHRIDYFYNVCGSGVGKDYVGSDAEVEESGTLRVSGRLGVPGARIHPKPTCLSKPELHNILGFKSSPRVFGVEKRPIVGRALSA